VIYQTSCDVSAGLEDGVKLLALLFCYLIDSSLPAARKRRQQTAPLSEKMRPEENQPALRNRTFLKGIVYYDNRRASIACTIRDLSDTGARIAFTTLVSVPDNIELHIPQKQLTLPAQVRRRDECEIGVSFQSQRSDEPRRVVDGTMTERVAKLEDELVAMKRLLKKLEAKVLPNECDL